MELHDLRPAAGATKKRKRVGRGAASGSGKTAGRGQDGQLSRSGGGKGPGFEGGQMPLQRRLPKLKGFTNHFRTDYQPINVGDLEAFDASSEVGRNQLIEKGLIRKDSRPIKVLGDGELTKSINVKVDAYSKSAVDKIEKAGGKADKVAR